MVNFWNIVHILQKNSALKQDKWCRKGLRIKAAFVYNETRIEWMLYKYSIFVYSQVEIANMKHLLQKNNQGWRKDMNSIIQMDSDINHTYTGLVFLTYTIKIVLNNRHVPRGLTVGKSNIWQSLIRKQSIARRL